MGKSLKSAARDWNKGRNLWPIGVSGTNNRIRFSKGWNTFVQENDLEVGDCVTFTYQADGLSFEIDVKYAKKKRGMKSAT